MNAPPVIPDDPRIYLLMTAEEIACARTTGQWESVSLSVEGFIHASPANQLKRVADKYYQQKHEVQVVCVRIDLLKPELRWEPAAGSLYPHIYGPLNFNSVVDIVPTQRNEDGTFLIPQLD